MKIKNHCSVCLYCIDYKNPKSSHHLNIVVCAKDPSYGTERFTPRYGVSKCSSFKTGIPFIYPIWQVNIE